MNWQPDESFARALDAADPLRHYREQFHIPRRSDGSPVLYFCGHSLGLQPRAARALVEQEMEAWARLGVDAHFHGKNPWYSFHENFRESGARLVGADPGEVVFMNSLTVNLHLMMMTFYRPTPSRYRILMDAPVFPSDLYAMQSQLRHHGIEAGDGLLLVDPGDIELSLGERGHEIAVVLLSGVNYLTGEYFDIPRLADAARRQGCVFALDLAHAAGNVVLHLHDWQVDFAVWCSYKYLNGGPGSVGGCFVHDKHGRDVTQPRLAGWWGNDPATRFQMQAQTDFVARAGADGWQISNPPILAMVPLLAALALFDEAGMSALRAKSERLTAYLYYLLKRLPSGAFEILTPSDPACRGCQLSLRLHDRPRELLAALQAEGVVCDFREPDVLRVAPVPLYNTFHEVWTFAHILKRFINQA
ncbi:MAG: kynureninase [Gemmataceae bacterium]